MENVEVYSYLFIRKEWQTLTRMPIPDKGFELSFREYLNRRLSFDTISDIRDMGLGLSYKPLSETNHELDLIGVKGKDLHVFELKHYETSSITKDIVFNLLGNVMDFFFKNLDVLSNFRILLFLTTINTNIDDSIRKLCLTFGIKLLEPSLMSLGTLDFFIRDLYQKTSDKDIKQKSSIGSLLEKVAHLKECYDYSFSDLFSYVQNKVHIDPALFPESATQLLNDIRESNQMFEGVRQEWKERKSQSHRPGAFTI
jgi:hypothetical protein